MAPTLQLVYPITLPRVGQNVIRYEEIIAAEPLDQFLRQFTQRRLDFITQLNAKEISAPNLQNIYDTGLAYLNFIHSFLDASANVASQLPHYAWRSGIQGEGSMITDRSKLFKDALNYEMCMILVSCAGSLTSYSSFLIEFECNEEGSMDYTVDDGVLANATKALAQAAGIYAYAHENIPENIQTIIPDPSMLPELNPKVLKGLSTYCCLSLQQCAYESARKTAGNPLLAKISMQVVDYSNQLKNYFTEEHGFAKILDHLTPVRYLYTAMANFHLAKEHWAKDEWGLACSYGKVAKNNLALLQRFEEKCSNPVLKKIMAREISCIEKTIGEYDNDNSNVYFARETPITDLQPIRGIAVKTPTKYVPDCNPEFTAMLAQLGYI